MSVEATAAVQAPAPEIANGESTSASTSTSPSTLHDDRHHPVRDNPSPGHVAQSDAKMAHGLADYATPNPSSKPIGLHSPPDSNSAMKLDGSDDDSELSDVEEPTLDPDQMPLLDSQPTPQEPLQEDGDIGEITPSDWSGNVPIFKPNMRQFKDFKKFMEKIDSYGMKSGIVKVVPPQEWKDSLPALDDLVKQIRVREPIKQEIMGTSGTYRQVNILHQRSYNLPQWRQLCDQSEHQPPARRGERRAQAPTKSRGIHASTGSRMRGDDGAGAGASTGGRLTRSRSKRTGAKTSAVEPDERPITPVSPRPTEAIVDSVEEEIGDSIDEDDCPVPRAVGRMGGLKQAKPKEQSTSARRKYARREGSAKIDEEAFRDFDYRMDISDYTPERCEELERTYWRMLTYAPPLYGADVLGTLFDDSTESWNLNKLPNLLDVLGTKVPGVNMAYLYLGMWKSTFAWHLEDVDLYSINYLHFGAPKQWYSISQGDARRFEAAMKSIWPTDFKACDQFLRHKAFLISPNHLQQNFNIKVNKVISYPGEFVVTYPYGYHSGYNLGYNCAEAVNFALDSWLPMGKIAKKCECAQAQDSVWVDVYEIERKLRGEETDYEETDDEEDEDEDEEDELEIGMPTPPSIQAIRVKPAGRKRKRATTDKRERKVKKIRLRLKTQTEPPCCLCPHDVPTIELLPTDDGRKAHRLCALYGAETWIEIVDGNEVVGNVANIDKARLDLKCLFCRSKKGMCFQCSHKKCVRAYHATCAAAAGVFVEEAEVPIFGEDGTEYKERAFEFNCRFHRTKRDRKMDGDALDDCQRTRQAASALKKGDVCQLQYHRGDIFAGTVIENRDSEQTLLLDIIPNGDRVEVEWKWLLLPDPADLHLPRASRNAIPMPTSRKAKDHINATRRRIEEPPRAGEPFVEGGFVWAEFNHHDLESNKAQAKVDLSKENQIWYYLGQNSTDARPRYTEDPQKRRHNSKSNFLDTIPRPAPLPPPPRKSYGSTFSINAPVPAPKPVAKSEKPYQYKPRDPIPPTYLNSQFSTYQFIPKPSPAASQQPMHSTSIGNTFIHHTQPTNRMPNYAPAYPVTPQPPRPSQYKFQHTPYIPPGQPAQRLQQSLPPPQALQSHQTPYNPQYNSLPQPNQPSQQLQQQPIQQATPQPASSSVVEFRDVAPGPQWSAQQLPATFAPQSGVNAVHTPTSSEPTPISRQPSITRPGPTPDAHGHTRNRSSVSSHGGRFTHASGQRYGTPSSYGHARRDSVTKSPFSIGVTQPPGLGPSPSPQNNSQFQSQARGRSSSLVSNLSLNTPMTSSAIRPSSSASATALAGRLQSVIESDPSRSLRPNIVQKYAFFQVHHNRDSTKYRTPYAQWGGFTNGYEGNLRAHLLQRPSALFDIPRKPLSLNATNAGLSSIPHKPAMGVSPSATTPDISSLQPQSPSTYHTSHVPPPTAVNTTGIHMPSPLGTQPTSSLAAPPPILKGSSNWYSSSVSDSNPADVYRTEPVLHPAVRAHYANMLQNRDVKLENQSDSGSKIQPLALIPQLPVTSSSSPTMMTPLVSGSPVPRPLSTPRSSRSVSRHVVQSKSTTPIPPPPIPMASNVSQSSNGPSSSAKVAPGPPKRTHIPAPRPWEALRKATGPTQPDMTRSSPLVSTTSSPVPTMSNPQTSFLTRQPENSGHSPDPRLQVDHAVQSAEFQHTPVQQPQFTNIPPPQHVTAVPSTRIEAAGPPFAVTLAGQQPLDPALFNTKAPTPPNQAVGTPDLPEVSDGSMELVESIIRNAQKASGSFF
ncbi:hypothetical protein GGR50DRAFT_697127 [Xylaria sp. CBS 124048]|nr:hypothetical protein GGR50DRAFT_697127 [Xylaria sp. CBS 124048]